MRVLVDASVFLKLLLDEPGADRAQEILEAIEASRILGYITPLILEEVAFKLVYAKASEILDTRNIWRIREALRFDDGVRRECMGTLRRFQEYIEYMLTRGLRVEYVSYEDWARALDLMEKYGLLPADAIHLAVAARIGADAIASFDEDFRYVSGLKVIP